MRLSIAEMQGRVRQFNVEKGWRVKDDHEVPDANGRTFGDDIALIHSELSEALEAYRDHGFGELLRFTSDSGFSLLSPDDPNAIRWQESGTLGKPEGVASELADVFVRLLDTCAHLGIDLEKEFVKKMDYNDTRMHRHGDKNL